MKDCGSIYKERFFFLLKVRKITVSYIYEETIIRHKSK